MNMSEFLLLLLFSSMASSPSSLASSDDDFVYAGCSQPQYAAASPYQSNVDALFSSLVNSAAFSSYANFTSAAGGTPAAYGLFQCRGDVAASECAACVRSGLSQLSALCPSAAGASVQLRGCYLRYGNDSFLGKPDTSVLYKKCAASPSAGGGHGDDESGVQLSMRDAALAALQTSGGESYKVSGAGDVKAVAQCVGDQSAKQCDECTAAAVARLREACGVAGARAGDAYLGKCYVRYSSDGVDASHDDHSDDSGKTVAIIIGLIAGVALLLLFLSFIRKAGKQGK